MEHTRSFRPADLAVVFLIASLTCDAIGILASDERPQPQATIFFGTISVLKLLIIAAESRGKGPILARRADSKHTPEQLAGVLNRTFFWWINPILVLGNRMILSGDMLPPIDDELSSKNLRRRALQAWDRRARPETITSLPKALARSMTSALLAPVLPRLFLISFRYAQPLLISFTIRQLNEQSSAPGWAVLMGSIIVYMGLAISKAIYHHRLNRLGIMVKASTIGLISNAALHQQSSSYDDGRAVTLMSTDTDGVVKSASMLHESWAHVVEVAIGLTLLARQVGWVFPVPIVIIFFCSRMSRYLAKNLQSKQKDWNAATQNRLALTTSALSTMKGIKMLGFSSETESLLRALREKELEMAHKVRWMMVAYNASANALGIFSPVLTFVIYAILASLRGSALDTETAFTTTALLGLVTHPANMIMTIVPQTIGSLAAYGRIQDYLLQPVRSDQRLLSRSTPSSNNNSFSHNQDQPAAITFSQVVVQPPSFTSPLLTDVSFTVDKGSLVVCTGPVGSGKTTLLNCILGEVTGVDGTISVLTKRIAYCEQSPWLPSGTLKDAVCGFDKRSDSGWYDRVIQLCCLDEDISTLPAGDDTLIGSRGLNLSGGQRQRVALARAVYARCDIVLLDDPFAALDGTTESRIVSNLLGPSGYFKKAGTTVILSANSGKHFHLADNMLLLDNGRVTPQASWDDLAHLREAHSESAPGIGGTESIALEAKKKQQLQSQTLKVAEAVNDLSRMAGDFSLYRYYLKSVGARNFFILATCTASYSFFVTFPQYWLQKWTEAPVSQTRFYIGGYLICSLLAWAATNGSMGSTHILIAPASGKELHRRLLNTIFGAPLSYFSATETGSILNRFSQDMQLVDKSLPPAVLSLLNQVFKLFVQAGLLFSAQKLLTATLPVCALVIYIIQKVYLRTSRQLRLLDLESQSAVYTNFLEAIEGVVCIRSFGWEKKVAQTNMEFLDNSQRPDYVLQCLQRWLSMVLDLMVAAIATCLIGLAVLWKDGSGTTSGQIGMALNIVLVVNVTLIGLVGSWTNMEVSLGAISRLKVLERDAPQEECPSDEDAYIPGAPWPAQGAIDISGVTVSYKENDAPALRDVNLSIPAGQQLIIRGRTGSGKSTLLLTLLRILDPRAGSISIDGINIGTVPKRLVRERCFITVAQEPFLLGQASLRFNLDPTGLLDNGSVLDALQRTGLWRHFEPDHEQDTHSSSSAVEELLRQPMASLPQMSTGQLQLFALTRAILRSRHLMSTSRATKPILLLDEATASVDLTTESTMRTVIKDVFTDNGHTVVEISHRQQQRNDTEDTTTTERPDSTMLVTFSQGCIHAQSQDII